jgi:hypothetical protein
MLLGLEFPGKKLARLQRRLFNNERCLHRLIRDPKQAIKVNNKQTVPEKKVDSG